MHRVLSFAERCSHVPAGGVTLSTGLAADTHLEAVDKNEKKRLLHFEELN